MGLSRNFLARQAAGIEVDGRQKAEQSQTFLGPYSSDYFIVHNLVRSEIEWANNDNEWVGVASMSKHHVAESGRLGRAELLAKRGSIGQMQTPAELIPIPRDP